ncbi:MAG: hypothetical protein IPG63_18370 [Xanthomonadales bacterium]|nr:hypothetical protein [Xanthomonadales bacterium]
MPNEIRTPRVNNWMGVAALGMACVLAISACGKKEEAAAGRPVRNPQPAFRRSGQAGGARDHRPGIARLRNARSQ